MYKNNMWDRNKIAKLIIIYPSFVTHNEWFVPNETWLT
jgi:hypothetical protein